MKKLISIVILIFIVLSCSDKKKELVQDNKTKNLPINSVIEIKKETISKGNQLFLDGKYQEALRFYEKGVKENRSVAYYNIGVSYYLLGDLEESEKYFKLAIDDDKNFKEAYINLVAVLIQENKVDEAEKYIQFLEGYKDLKTYINLANLYLKKGSTAKSYYYFQKAMEIDEKNEFVRASYGNFLISIEEVDKGIEILSKIKKKGYDEYYNLAKAYFYKKDYRKSIDNVKKAIDLKKTEQALKLLAENYNKIQDYILEATVLSQLIEISNKPEFRYRYALALYKSGDFSKAKEVVTALINEFPNESRYYKLKYDILINERKYNEALQVVKNAYTNLKSSFFRYLYIRHLLLYFDNVKKAYQLIKNVKEEDDYILLSKAIYYAKIGKFQIANNYLSNISNKGSDYYLLVSYILLKQRDYKRALENIEKISRYENRYYLYKFIALWNLGYFDALLTLSKERLNYLKYNRELPKVSFKLKSSIYDIGFFYRYDGKFEDILRLFLFPLVIDPNESIEFLTLGYKLLQDNENLKAIIELKKSANFNNGIMYNNKGVDYFLNGDFYKAINYFQKAAKYLKNNPFVTYNLGIGYLALGDLKKAYYYFDNSLLNNRFILYSYLGKAVVFYLRGEATRIISQYDLVINNYDEAVNSVNYPHIFLLAKYFAMIGLGKYDDVIFEISNSKSEFNYELFVGKLAQFMKEGQVGVFDKDEFSVIYHFECFDELLRKDFSLTGDRVCKNYKLYSNLYLSKRNMYNFSNKMDKYELAQYIMYNLAINQLDNVLKGLKILSRKDFRYSKLYEISLYYFLLKKDFVNAEASYTALEKLKFKNLFTQYYRMLYFLLNYNEKRLIKEINSFIKEYPVDYRGLMVDTLLSFKNNNLKKVLDDLISMKNIEPKINEKVNLEILIDDI
ncbi:tetratricopeptide repeat protein [Deferribacter autotrophicus]|uniref:Tetratricopeptide repeat protein n=1 Tax=Deferribacter autotrophicus TaxID=500465 RepID=A0A5A8F931_9BACT|nr:tetratricopeptide repeat protein [Deferribacter autotrophicus]KAA0259422.1 tetratricopeptide repeat protein [Deferribacter autotrophicus]